MKLEMLRSVIEGTDSAKGYAEIDGNDDAHALSGEGHIEVNPSVPGLAEGKVAARVTQSGRDFAAQSASGVVDNAGTTWNGTQEAAQFATQNIAPTNFGEAAAQQAAAQVPATTQHVAQSENKGPAFVSVSGVGFTPAAPAKREGVKRDVPEKYPFGELKAPIKNADGSINYDGAVVFVPSTKDKTGKLRTGDEMAFSLQSACNAANRRYGRELPPKVGTDGKSRKQYEYDRTFKAQGGTHNGQEGAFIYREFREQSSQA